MEMVTANINLTEFFFSNFDSCRVIICAESTSDSQSRTGGCGGNEIDHNLMTDKRLASPVLTDVGEEPMFDLVPFAGAGGQVANRDLKAGFIGQLLQLGLPQPGPVTVAASTIGRDQ